MMVMMVMKMETVISPQLCPDRRWWCTPVARAPPPCAPPPPPQAAPPLAAAASYDCQAMTIPPWLL